MCLRVKHAMLAFLDTFCQALCARDGSEIRRLLRHPLARALPHPVRVEAMAVARAGNAGVIAPTRALHFYYQTLQLLASPESSASRAETPESTPSVESLFEFHRADHPTLPQIAIPS